MNREGGRHRRVIPGAAPGGTLIRAISARASTSFAQGRQARPMGEFAHAARRRAPPVWPDVLEPAVAGASAVRESRSTGMRAPGWPCGSRPSVAPGNWRVSWSSERHAASKRRLRRGCLAGSAHSRNHAFLIAAFGRSHSDSRFAARGGGLWERAQLATGCSARSADCLDIGCRGRGLRPLPQ
jgi:hypothetical protein